MFMEMAGLKFGRLLVLERVMPNDRHHNPRWRCICDCGREHVTVGASLRRGLTVSCGCKKAEFARSGLVRLSHGHNRQGKRSPEYRTWASMNWRCATLTPRTYFYYGARGITVCDRWRDSFEAFLADVGPRPSLAHTIDRINNEGNYEPGNVRWATKKEQSNNRRPRRKAAKDDEAA